jgi:tight adherence protein C
MEELVEIRVLLPAVSTLVAMLLMIWVTFEYRRYQRHQKLNNLSSITGASPANLQQQTKRESLFHQTFLRFSTVSVALGEKINLFRTMKKSITGWLRRAGVRDKNAVVYVIGAKLLGIPVMMGVTYLLFAPYDSFQDHKNIYLVVAAIIGFSMPDLWILNLIQKRQTEIIKNWADVLDVILISVTSGKSIEMAMRKAALEMATVSPELAKELTITLTELSLLEKRSDAYRRLAERLPFPFVKNFVFDVIQSENLGTPLARALTQIAQENRLEKMQNVEKKAAALGPKLTVPMILFFFPLLFIIIMAPAFL